MEASTNQVAEQHMQFYDLPWKILCEVMNVELKVIPPLVANVTSAFQPCVLDASLSCRLSQTMMRFMPSSLCYLNQR